MTVFNWQDIDHSLVSLKLTELVEEMHTQINAEERRIQFENRHNPNTGAVPSLILQMKEQRADEWVRRAYDIYCDVWRIQGRTKSASFVRAVFARGIRPMLNARAGAIAHEFGLFSRRRGFPTQLAKVRLDGLRLRMTRLQDRWRRRLEVEARESEHAERRKRLEDPVLSSSSIPVQVSNSPSLRKGVELAAETARETRNDEPVKAGSIQQAQGAPESGRVEGATWDTIEISFLSDERVQIRSGTSIETRNYAEFGFGDRRDRRSGKPNLAWKTFRVLAEECGVIRDAAKTGRTWAKVEKRIQEIRKVLQKHFHISADPIPFVKGTGYQARFKISCSRSYDT